MSIPAPIILLPTEGIDYATDVQTQTLSGTTSTDTKEILVNNSTIGVSYTSGEGIWAWTGDLALGSNALQITAVEVTTLEISPPATINVTYVQSDNFVVVSAPTGIKLKQYQDQVEVVCSKNSETNTLGYNFYVSTQSGGINGKYAKINTQLVTDYSFFEDQTRLLNTTTDTAGTIRVTTITQEVNRVYFYSSFLTQARFSELVGLGALQAVSFGEDTPLFFVITAEIYDPILGQVSESVNSSELEGSPITITTGIRDLPSRTQNDIVQTLGTELSAVNSGVDTKPGTVVRDIIDPISEEMARMYVINDFISTAMSVSTLLDFDDANHDGVSDPVNNSVEKKKLQIALFITDPTDVQTLIDSQFDKLAANVNVIRKGAAPATGSVTFYTNTPPVRDMFVYEDAIVASIGDMDQGIPSQNYRTLTTKILQYTNKEAFYNTQTGRYELTVDVDAVTPGASGNTDSYTIKNNVSGVDSDFQVENPNPIAFGEDQESNQELSTRIELAFFADTGTEGGYAKTAIAVTGVHNVRVEKAGDPLMIRDYDPVRQEHIGGKVDIYVQGKHSRQVSDQIAFSFESIISKEGLQEGEIFPVLSAPSFQFRSNNPRITSHTPIFEVTRVFNSTRGKDYDITGYQIIGNGNTIDLDETRPTNITIGLASRDVVRVDYKFRSSDTFVLKNQPVLDIISVRGQLSGDLTSDNWELVKLQDPLADGGSTIAKDAIRIKYANNLPLTDFQTIVDEQHVMVLGVEEALDYIGADIESIVIKNSDHTVTYQENVDYRITAGTDTTPSTIRLIETGNIANGQIVLISYTAIENFIITYTTNDLLNTVQTSIDKMKHACADVIVKQAIENNIDFVITVVPKTGVTNLPVLSSKIRTAVANYVSQLGVGVSLSQAEVVNIIQLVPDVDYIVLPFLRMVKSDGDFIARDNIGSVQFELYNEGLSTSYITTTSALTYKTVDKGGSENLFRGIFENTMPLVLQNDPLDVSGGPGRGYIQADGKIVVSTLDGQLPDTKDYQVAYFVTGETGSKDIAVASLEYLNIGNMDIVYDNPRTIQKQL